MAKPKIIYDSRLLDATPAASSTASGDVLNLRDSRPYTWWTPTALPATVTVDCGSAKAADMLAIAGHNLFACGCTVQVRGSTDNFAASDVLVATVTPTDDTTVAVQTWVSVSYRYWRLRITGTTAPSLAVAMVGAAMELPVGLEAPFDPVGRKLDGRRVQNNNGQPLGHIVDYARWEQTINLRAVTWTWARTTWLAAWQAALGSEPFVFSWDPTNYPAEARLVTTDGDFSTPHRSDSLCDLSVNLRGVA